MKLKYALTFTALFIMANNAFASNDKLFGVWQTERGDSGGYLHVKFATCDKAVCGTIVAAYNKKNELGKDYEHLGKKMVWGMRENGTSQWAGGKIWDPVEDNTYKSKMIFEGNKLNVSGCFLFFCKGQSWTRVK